MGIHVLEIHHHALRIDSEPPKLEAVQKFYKDVLGLEADPGRPKKAWESSRSAPMGRYEPDQRTCLKTKNASTGRVCHRRTEFKGDCNLTVMKVSPDEE